MLLLTCCLVLNPGRNTPNLSLLTNLSLPTSMDMSNQILLFFFSYPCIRNNQICFCKPILLIPTELKNIQWLFLIPVHFPIRCQITWLTPIISNKWSGFDVCVQYSSNHVFQHNFSSIERFSEAPISVITNQSVPSWGVRSDCHTRGYS